MKVPRILWRWAASVDAPSLPMHSSPSSRLVRIATLSAALGWLAIFNLPSSQAAEDDRVQFDVEPLVAVTDITTAADRLHQPDRRVMRARIRLSVLYPPDSTRNLAELLVRVESPDRRAQVVDYAPRTTLATNVAGAVRVERHEESSSSLNFEAKAQYPGFFDGHVEGARQHRVTQDSHWEDLPPLQLNIASGTVNRGFGAYFKFKPNSRSTLEGEQEIELSLSVPRTWRGDCLIVKAEAFSQERFLVGGDKALRRWTERRFLVLLHEAGDLEARAAAQQVLLAEAHLRRITASERAAAARSAAGWSEWSGLFQPSAGSLVPSWWDDLVYGPMATRMPRLPDRASASLRDAALRYRESRVLLARLPTTTSVAALERLPPVDR